MSRAVSLSSSVASRDEQSPLNLGSSSYGTQPTRPPSLSLSALIGDTNAAMPSTISVTPPPGQPLVSPTTGPRNPFRYTSRVDLYEKIKMAVVCLLGIPLLRLALLLLVVIALALLSCIATMGYVPVDPQTKQRRPFPKWRQWIMAPRPFLIRVVLFALGYHWISIKLPPGGLLKPNDMPRIIVANHVSFIDGPFLSYYLNASIAMKAELGHVPVLGRIIQTLQPILIDRNTPEGRKRALQDIADHLASPDLYPPLLIFPEGTTSNQHFLTKFKVGSFASGLPCLPVTLKYPFKHFDVSWTPDVSGGYLLLRMLCQVHNRLDVELLPPYVPTEEEKARPETYAEGVRRLMAETLSVDYTNHAFEDVALLLKVGQYAEQHVVPITDVSEVATLTALHSGDVQKLVKYFIKRDLNGDGQISLDEMCALFPTDNPELLERLFALLDLDGNGSIDFRELCMGLAALNPSRDAMEMLQFAFRLYDLDGNGVIDRAELDRMLYFFRSYYGAEGADVELHVDDEGRVNFDAFAEFMGEHPVFLGHAKSKLEILRGSLRGDSDKSLRGDK